MQYLTSNFRVNAQAPELLKWTRLFSFRYKKLTFYICGLFNFTVFAQLCNAIIFIFVCSLIFSLTLLFYYILDWFFIHNFSKAPRGVFGHLSPHLFFSIEKVFGGFFDVLPPPDFSPCMPLTGCSNCLF